MSLSSRLRHELHGQERLWLLLVAGFVLIFHAVQLALLVVRFGHLPNYVTVFDWPHNIATIIRSTQSAQDMVSIILDEWILEFGYMNHDFGHGISEWSLVILPAKLLFVLVWAALLATDVVLICRAHRSCDAAALAGGIAATTAGALIAGVTSVTMTWVVCCATPSRVVGLTVLGGGVSTALAMQPIGAWLAFSALAALLSVTLGLELMIAGPEGGPSSDMQRYEG